jgi:hypothetical protein
MPRGKSKPCPWHYIHDILIIADDIYYVSGCGTRKMPGRRLNLCGSGGILCMET